MGVWCTWVKLEEICRFWTVNCTKIRLAAAGFCSDPLGSYSYSGVNIALPQII